MTSRSILPLTLICALGLTGCFEDPVPNTTASTSDSTGTGDGDGDPTTTTTGDGDGDPTTTGDGDGDPATGDGDGDPTTTGDMPCGVGFSCFIDPGPPWEGPFVVGDACAANSYGVELVGLFDGLEPGQPNCACQCGAPDVTCSNSMSVIGYAAGNCANGQGANNIGPNECYNTFAASHGLSLGNATATCGQGNVVEDIPEPTFDVSLLGCGLTEPAEGMCDPGSLCAPDPIEFEGGVCFSTPGDVTCPAGYPDKTVYATGYEDTRMCADSCSCSSTGATCRVSVTGYASDNCVSAQGAISVNSGDEECVAVSQAVQSIRPGNVVVQNAGACTPQGEVATSGEVVSTGQLTVCCTG